MFTYKDANGALTLERKGNLILATFSGAINTSIMKHFIDEIDDSIAPIQGQAWAYVSDSRKVHAATPDSEESLKKAVLKYYQLGCVCGAYVSTSAVMINQMDRVLKGVGVPTGIDGKLFESTEAAKAFCTQTLLQLSDSN